VELHDVVIRDLIRQDLVFNMTFEERFEAALSYLNKVPLVYRKFILEKLSTDRLALNEVRSREFYGW